MSKYKIEKGIFLPNKGHVEWSRLIEQMEIGDSVEMSTKEALRFYAAKAKAVKAAGLRLAMRKMSEEYTRIWLLPRFVSRNEEKK